MQIKRIPLFIASSFAIGLLWFQPAAGMAAPPVTPPNSTMVTGREQPVVSADKTIYNESTGRYTLQGNVRIAIGGRTFSTDEAKISSQTLQIWTDGHTELHEGELCFTGDAIYAELAGNTAWFFGVRCGLKRPGLVIHADTMNYNWETHIVTFDGHVYCTQHGYNTTTSHLEFDLEKNIIVG